MIGRWLATAWEASLTKGIIGAALGAVLSWLTTANIDPLLVGIGAATIPLVINAMNKYDPRYGVGKQTPLSDLATAHEFQIEGE
ncbi:hypothetical protein UFOVP1213_5 [uncultured Caudovirales phage]|uniref:Holin n=1 Tax=uncultured Caudovirales phage TaxID=2100421 RepID=A0A6J5R535_9CAUD|nr:hypothetical protein UFOVP1213_5 [uncultured Caudovirales phage]